MDVVDDKVNKLYKRSGKVVLNGSENWTKYEYSTSGNKGFVSDAISNLKPITSSIVQGYVICDRFNSCTQDEVYNNKKIGVAITTTGKICFNIEGSKLGTPDVVGFKKWLQANNVTVVYQLAQEEVFDIAPLNLSAYANETMISINSGAINPPISFAITSHIGNMVLQNTKRIDRLEDNVFKAMKMVLSGDMQSLAYSLYPEDFNNENDVMLLPVD